MLLNEESRVDAFIKWLRSKQYRSHFLITKPSTMEEVRRTVIHITRKGQWIHTTSSKRYKSDSTSSSCSESDQIQISLVVTVLLQLSVGLLLVILTSSINILVIYLLVLLAIYLQINTISYYKIFYQLF